MKNENQKKINTTEDKTLEHILNYKVISLFVAVFEFPDYLAHVSRAEKKQHWQEYKQLLTDLRKARKTRSEAVSDFNYINSFKSGECIRHSYPSKDEVMIGGGSSVISSYEFKCPVDCSVKNQPDCKLLCPLKQKQEEKRKIMEQSKTDVKNLTKQIMQYWPRKMIVR